MAGDAASPNLKTYHGNCHCGAFRYSVKLPHLDEVEYCNCSFCAKKGILWAFPASLDDLVVEKGKGTLKGYEFGNKTMVNEFCPDCGTMVMAHIHRESESLGINVRTLQDFDPEPLKIIVYDGAAMKPVYTPPDVPNPSNVDTSKEVYKGSCHCGKVTFNLQSEPLNQIDVIDCNCTICTKNGYLCLYPLKDAVEVQGEENLRYYSRYFKPEEAAGHGFCTTCGVFPLNKSGGSNAYVRAINVRTIDGVNLDELKIRKHNGKTLNGKPYVLDAE